jgi:methylenetetrahydrofolate reductase (NADPH)
MTPLSEKDGASRLVAPLESPPSLAEALQDYSVELNPKGAKVAGESLNRLDPGTEVFLTWIPGADPMEMVAFAANLRRAGVVPVPHIGARHVQSKAQLERLAERLASEAEVDRVLLVGGDRCEPAGPYDSTLALMQSGVFQSVGIDRVAVAGFPEGNPNIPRPVLAEALETKVRFARNEGLRISIVTQFCFQAEPILKWLRQIRAAAIDVPVRIGLAGPAGLVTLTRYAVRCGVGNSLRVLMEKPSFAKLLTERGPEPIVRSILSSVDSETDVLPPGVAGFHFFAFGGLTKTIDWISAKRAE